MLWCHLEVAYNSQVQTGPLALVLGGYAYSGVVLFFVLSGFLLFLPYARALLSGDRWPSASNFYLRRGLRILPSYYAVLLVFPVYLVLFHREITIQELHPAQAFLGLTLLYDLRADISHLLNVN